LGIVNAQSAAAYIMPRESNGYEGYLRFVYADAAGSAGFDFSGALWAHRVAVSLSSTGVLQKEIERAPWADPLDG
jgi:hypothetical protein